jgi:hypothetical protein
MTQCIEPGHHTDTGRVVAGHDAPQLWGRRALSPGPRADFDWLSTYRRTKPRTPASRRETTAYECDTTRRFTSTLRWLPEGSALPYPGEVGSTGVNRR